MAITAAVRQDIMELAVLMNNSAPGTTLLGELVAKSVAGSSLSEIAEHLAGRAEFTAKYPTFQTATEFANEWLGNALPEADADLLAQCVTIVEAHINGGGSIADLVVAVQTFMSDPANADGAVKTHIDNFNNKVSVATYHTITKESDGEWAIPASVTSDAATVTTGNAAVDTAVAAATPANTIALTTGLDTSSGTAGDDTFTAVETAVTNPATDTLTTGDNLTGGGGTDTLSIAVSGTPAGGITSGIVTSGIEALKVFNNSTAVYEVDAALMSGFTDIYVSGGTFKTTIDDVDTLANLHLLSTNVDAEVSTTAAAVAGDADSAVVLSNGTAQTGAVTATYDGVEIINFNAAGATGIKTATVDRSLTLASNQLEKVVVTGSAAANITVDLTGADLETQTSELDASAAGGAITAHVTKGDSATVKVTMSAQDDWLDYNGALASTATLDGGAGSDTLELDTDLAYSSAATAQAGAGVSNFEVLRLASGTDVDERALTGNAGITSVTAVAGGSYTKSTALDSVTQLSSGTFTTTAATDGAADTLTVNLVGAGVASTLSAANVETLTVTSGGTAANTLTMSAAQSADLTSLTASGTQSLTANISGTSLATVDASGVTGVGNAFVLGASASTAALTVTASGVRPTVSATGLANTITTGSGADNVTGGAYRDIITTNDGDDTVTSGDGNDTITTGRGADTITAGDGDLNITSGIGNDTVTVGKGTNTINLGSGNDTLTTGNGKNTITLGVGDDTVTAGSGADTVIMTDYDNDDVIDLGGGTDTLLRDALPTTGAYAAAADFVDIATSVTPKISNVENLYLQHTTLAGNDGVATKETIDLTSSTGLGALYLDIVDGDTNDDSVYDITNFSGSAIHLSQTSGESPDVMNIDGTGQAALTIKTYDFNASAGTDIVVTQVDALTVDTYETVTVSGVTSEVANTTLGSITADGSDSVTVKIDGQAANLGAVTFVTGAVSADSAQTLALSAGSNGELEMGAITSTSSAVDTITLTTSDDGILDLTSIDVTGSDLSSLTITNGIGGRIDLDGAGDTTPITADSITAATLTLGAASNTGLDLLYGGTTTIAMTTGSTLDLDDVGVAATTSSTTVTGRGTLQGDLDILGNAAFNFSGLETGGAITLDLNDDTGNKTITTNRYDYTLDMAATGADTLTTGVGSDAIYADNAGNKTAFASADVTVSANGAATGAGSAVISFAGLTLSTGAITKAGANITLAELGAGIRSAINADPAMSKVLVATGAGVAVILTSLIEGTYAVKPTIVMTTATNSPTYIAGTATAGTLGAGGNDTVSAGDGVNVVYGGAGNDSITSGGAADLLIGATGTDTISAGGGIDIIEAGPGADIITGGGGLDVYRMGVGDGTPTIGGTGDAGTITGFDVITDYALGTASTNAETIDLLDVADAVVANSTGTNGTDSTLTIGGVAVKSHAIASGIVTFDDADTYAAALTIDSAADLAAVVQYLVANDLGNAGDTVAFTGNGNTYVYTQSTNAAGTNVNLVELTGVTGTSVSATNATTAGLIDINI